MAEDIANYCREHNLGEINLLGHSMGGKVAMQTALDYPNLVYRLAVADIAPVEYPSRHEKVFAGLEAVSREDINSRSRAQEFLSRHLSDSAVRAFLLKSLDKKSEGNYQWKFNLKAIKSNYNKLSIGNTGDAFSGPTRMALA